ncbi:TspO/MBR family protein [Paraliobacillus salinarum]|uniref:TspO/MBR family protein n=1 Tax=Paraliobacillus salinarum TaxID=1158996 RepID=UPI0015F65E73|nr:TspO/MBR family protein [Paraliobacillus salinarum]
MKVFISNLVAILMVIAVNGLANILPINGQTTGEISNQLPVLFTPAGYVFSIWGLIYALLVLWVLRQLPSQRRDLPLYQETFGLFWISCVLNVAWILSWHYNYFAVSVIVMISLLITLIVMYLKVKERKQNTLDLLPFSIYLGWISVATIANISYYLIYIDWNGFGLSDQIWTMIMLVIAAVLAIWFRSSERDIFYPLVFVWAIIGIGVKNQATYPVLSYFAYAIAAIIFISLFIRKKERMFS